MAKFRKKPVVIETIRFTGDLDEAIRFLGTQGIISGRERALRIKTLEGLMLVSVGDWIIRGVKGEFYPCKPDIFEETYEEVNDASNPS